MENPRMRYLKFRSFYEDAIRKHVCSRCIDFGRDGVCYTEDRLGCAVFRYLPELVAISERLDEPRIEPYVNAVRETICVQCRALTQNGTCPLREKIDCGLDRYLVLVFEAIEDVNAALREAA